MPSGESPAHVDTARTVLLAPLHAGDTAWTSRTVAAQLGVSQSRVARVWREVFVTRCPTSWSQQPPDMSLRLCAVLVGGENSMLVFEHTTRPSAAAVDRATFMRSPLRPHVQSILAADLLSPDTRSGAAEAFVQETVAGRTARSELLVVAKHPCALPRRTSAGQRVRGVLVGAVDWQSQLLDLTSRLETRSLPRLADAHMRLRRWARDPGRDFEWSWPDTTPGEPHRASTPRPSLTRSLGDEAVALMQDDIARGLTGPRHGFSETDLATRLHTSRQHVRDALRLLAGEGLVELSTGGRASVPVPTPADVLETYAARRALGSLIVSRLAALPEPPAAQIRDALDQVVHVAATRDVVAAGTADLDFQDALARLTDMRRIPAMFLRLTTQLRLFMSVLGLGYEFSPAQIVSDNSRLVEALLDQDRQAAIVAWRSKVNGAVSYMLETLPDVSSDLTEDRGPW